MDLHPSRPAADRTIDDRLSGGGSGGHHSDSGGHNSDSGGRHSDRVEFSAKGPRVRLTGVVIQNQGIDWSHPGNIYWQHKVCSICFAHTHAQQLEPFALQSDCCCDTSFQASHDTKIKSRPQNTKHCPAAYLF